MYEHSSQQGAFAFLRRGLHVDLPARPHLDTQRGSQLVTGPPILGASGLAECTMCLNKHTQGDHADTAHIKTAESSNVAQSVFRNQERSPR